MGLFERNIGLYAPSLNTRGLESGRYVCVDVAVRAVGCSAMLAGSSDPRTAVQRPTCTAEGVQPQLRLDVRSTRSSKLQIQLSKEMLVRR